MWLRRLIRAGAIAILAVALAAPPAMAFSIYGRDNNVVLERAASDTTTLTVAYNTLSAGTPLIVSDLPGATYPSTWTWPSSVQVYEFPMSQSTVYMRFKVGSTFFQVVNPRNPAVRQPVDVRAVNGSTVSGSALPAYYLSPQPVSVVNTVSTSVDTSVSIDGSSSIPVQLPGSEFIILASILVISAVGVAGVRWAKGARGGAR